MRDMLTVAGGCALVGLIIYTLLRTRYLGGL